ncbi:Cupredoxin superfamily protein [Striga hermonthica]|uniref:Cupredoxin superfamily protein n=1 Tax=Striga hermonthica TaxID=68872 RepID=A0A9N7MQ14_STRHE|nr:Cupredoxin superfamily protein [Striga hermonthica]
MEVSSKIVQVLVVFVIAIAAEKSLAATHVVGGSQGWEQSTDFDSWASSQTFKVGDELEFKYTSMHSVVELNEDAYKKCDVGSPLNSFNDGDTKIKLNKAGTRYFACGTAGHCGGGMKVKITTVEASGSSSSSGPSASNPPSTPGAAASTSTASGKARFFGFFGLVAALMVVFYI